MAAERGDGIERKRNQIKVGRSFRIRRGMEDGRVRTEIYTPARRFYCDDVKKYVSSFFNNHAKQYPIFLLQSGLLTHFGQTMLVLKLPINRIH